LNSVRSAGVRELCGTCPDPSAPVPLLVTSMGDNPGVTTSLLPELLAGDRAPAPSTLVALFQHVVSEHGDAPAVDSGLVTMTYTELEEAASELAERLAEHGVGPGD